MDLSFLQGMYVPVIVGICLCVGYVIKNSLSFIPNKYIPLIMLVLGLVINVLINHGITADVALAGMISGLGSTGMYEMFRNILDKGSSNITNNS
ncbi:MAG: phage holin family protein, partial [Peptostreptococcaceae bacterium]